MTLNRWMGLFLPWSADHSRAQRGLPWIAVLGAAVTWTLLCPGSSAQAQQCTTTGTNQTCTNSISLSGGATGLTDTGTATVTNTDPGTIFGNGNGPTNTGIRANGINLNNFGTVSGSSSGFTAEGIEAANTANVTNHGAISATGSGSDSHAANAIVAGNATVTNFGTITATSPISAFGISVSDAANVTNSGTISATGVKSLFLPDGTAFFGAGGGIRTGTTANVTNSGSITGSGGGSFGSGWGILAGGTANVTNSGTITGSGGGASGNGPDNFSIGDGYGIRAITANVTNSGTITGTLSATGNSSVGILADTGNVSNSGTISGTLSAGASIGLLIGNVRVTNSGTISGTGRNGYGIFATTADVTNTGTILGTTVALQFAGTSSVFNAGTLTGLSGTAIAFGGSLNTLTLGPGSTINGLVKGTGTDILQLGGTGTDTFDASLLGAGRQYSGFSTLNKLADSNWTLTGNSSFTGPTNVNGGILSVNGSLANSAVTVNAGGTLGGNGTVGNTTINGGTLAPGNSIGTLTVQGNLVFTAAASYMIEVSPANADRTNVTGTATLGGATVKASFAAGTYVARQYTILNATGGVSGTFNTLSNTDLPANFKSSLSYDSNNAYLNLALTFIPPPGSGLNSNQQSAANAIVGFFNSNGGIPLVFGGLTPTGLTQISGEVATGTQQTTFDAMGLFMGLMTDPFVAGRGDPVSANASAPQFAEESDAANAYAANGKARSKTERDAYAAVYRKAPVLADPFIQRWSVWAAGYGGSQTTDGNAVLGSNNTRSSIGGVAVGADYRFSPYTLAGFALAGGATNFSVNGLGSGRSDLFQAGAFVRHNVGAAYLTGALAYGWQDITTDRTVTVAGTDLLRAQFNANAFSGRAEGGYRFATPWLGGIGLTPYAAGQFVTFDLPAYAEQAIAGANTFALSYASKTVTDTRSELGLRTDKSFAMQNGIFTLRGRAAWAHDFNTDRAITPTFQTLPGASFVVNGAAPAHDSALVTASAEMKWLNGFSLAGTFEGEFSDVTRSYAGKGVVRYSW
jgi:uncharacterized protein with beta-barrel porin domain